MTKELAILINDEKGDTVFSHIIKTDKEKRAVFLTQLRFLLEMIEKL